MVKLLMVMSSLLCALALPVYAVPVSYDLLPCSVLQSAEAQRTQACEPVPPLDLGEIVVEPAGHKMLVRDVLLDQQATALHPLFLLVILAALLVLIARLTRSAK